MDRRSRRHGLAVPVSDLPGVDALREDAARLARELVRPQQLPSVGRVATVGYRLGSALLGWGLRDRGTPSSRSGLSRRLRPAFERLGPTYIKLGQIISSGEGIFPEELVEEFRLLRDRVAPEPFATVRRTVEEDLGRSLADVFVSFDRVPIASASIAQVHAATLRSGERVVVKVQRRSVASLVRLDIAAMSWIAPQLVGRIPIATLTNPPALVDLFAETIVEELDFRLEAQNMLDIAAVFASSGQRSIVVPGPIRSWSPAGYWSWSTSTDSPGAMRPACGRPASTPPRYSGRASSPSWRGPCSTGCSTVTSTVATSWCRPTGPWPCWTSGSPAASTSASGWRFCACRWGPRPTTSPSRSRPSGISGPCPPTPTWRRSSGTWGWIDRPSIPPHSPPTRWWPSSGT